jgi:hypothetical protein
MPWLGEVAHAGAVDAERKLADGAAAPAPSGLAWSSSSEARWGGGSVPRGDLRGGGVGVDCGQGEREEVAVDVPGAVIVGPEQAGQGRGRCRPGV